MFEILSTIPPLKGTTVGSSTRGEKIQDKFRTYGKKERKYQKIIIKWIKGSHQIKSMMNYTLK